MKRIALLGCLASLLGAQDATRWIDHVTPTYQPFETFIYVTNFDDMPCEVTFQPYDIAGHRLTDVHFVLAGFETVKQISDDVFGEDPVSHFRIVGDSSCKVTVGYRLYDGLGATAHLVESPHRFVDFVVYPGEPEFVFDGMAAVNFGVDPAVITADFRNSAGETLRTEQLSDGLQPLHKGLWLLDELITEDTSTISIHSSQPIDVTLLRGTRPDVVPGYLFEVTPIGEPSTAFKQAGD